MKKSLHHHVPINIWDKQMNIKWAARDLIDMVVKENNISEYDDFTCDKMKKLAIALQIFGDYKGKDKLRLKAKQP